MVGMDAMMFHCPSTLQQLGPLLLVELDDESESSDNDLVSPIELWLGLSKFTGLLSYEEKIYQ